MGKPKLEFVLGGQVIAINRLSDEMDDQFQKLHSAYLAGSLVDLAEFEKAVGDFLDDPGTDWRSHDSFFENFTVMWQHFLNSGERPRAEQVWTLALRPVLAWEKANPGKRVHKGVPFYFSGMAALTAGDLDRGYALMHQALVEDKTTHGVAQVDTPAYALVVLDWSKADQAFRQWVVMQSQELSRLLESYVSTHGKGLTLEDLSSDFLKQPSCMEAAFLLAYVSARLIKLGQIPSYARDSVFMAQLEHNLLFDLTLVIDASVKRYNPKGKSFIEHMEFLATKAGLQLDIVRLREANGLFNADFDAALRSALGGTFSFKDGTLLTGIERSMVITYGIRNRGAHNAASAAAVADCFPKVLQAAFDTLFLAVEVLK